MYQGGCLARDMGKLMFVNSLLILTLMNVSLAAIARRNIGQAVQNRVRIPLSTAEPTEEERQYFAELPHHFRLDDPIITGRLRPIARRERTGPPPAPRERKMIVPKYTRQPLEWDSNSQSASESISSTRSSEEAAYQQAKWDTRAKTSMMCRSQARSGSSN